MSSIATFECYNKTWVAEQAYGEINRHSDIAIAAINSRTPFCRKHLLSRERNKDPFLSEFRNQLLRKKFDLSIDFDTIVVQHDTGINPIDELNELENNGHMLAGLIDDIPDYAYLDGIATSGASMNIVNARLLPSEIDDLAIARRSLTNMLLRQFND